jgi:3-hydroxymyristoyl/3-hydroxydecanoyl-(acyl carrier protein) dehydratase
VVGDAFAEVTIAGGDARARVSPAHAAALCAGHFPDDPLVPGAYLLELMADLAEHLVPAARERQGRPPVVVRCAFAARVRPTHAIALHARRDAADVVEVDVMADGTRAASATLAFGTPP